MTAFFKKHTLIFGTLFLTTTGFLSRILGFFYRIFLSRTIGAEGLGLYQIIFPVYGICFSLCAGSIQTAISRFTASAPVRAKKTLLAGFFISFSMSLLLAFAIWTHAECIAVHILMEPRCASLLPALALAIPCTAVHACICGYYYGKEKVQVPAISQLVEQCIRIFSVFYIAKILHIQGQEVTVLVAVIGLVIGEAASALFTLLCFCLSQQQKSSIPPHLNQKTANSDSASASIFSSARMLMHLATPLMANHLIINLLKSVEAILIPNRLGLFGLTPSQSLGLYGTLTGMAMPFIMFPSAIVNSLAVILLPKVARHQADGNIKYIENSLLLSFRYSLYMGILCTGIFIAFGDRLGILIFDNVNAGSFITILAWLCPFFYLVTSMRSILNGLGKTSVTFLHNLLSLLLRLAFIYWGVPKFGIAAVLWGMLASEILLMLLHLNTLLRTVSLVLNAFDLIAKPMICLFLTLGIRMLFFPSSPPRTGSVHDFLLLVFELLFTIGSYGLFLLFFRQRR